MYQLVSIGGIGMYDGVQSIAAEGSKVKGCFGYAFVSIDVEESP